MALKAELKQLCKNTIQHAKELYEKYINFKNLNYFVLNEVKYINQLFGIIL